MRNSTLPGALLLGAVLALPTLVAHRDEPALVTDAATREFSIFVGDVSFPFLMDAFTREFSVFVGDVVLPPTDDAVTREFSIFVGDVGFPSVRDAVTREFSVFVGDSARPTGPDAVSREFSVFVGDVSLPTVTDAVTREFSVCSAFSGVAWEPERIDLAVGETVEISYYLCVDATVRIEFYEAENDHLVRTIEEAQLAGPNTVIWDGHGNPLDPGAPEPPPLPEGIYYFELVGQDGGGRQFRWSKMGNTAPSLDPSLYYVDTTDFDPWQNKPAEIGFTLSDKGYLPITIVKKPEGDHIRRMTTQGLKQLAETVYWDGRYDADHPDYPGKIYSGLFQLPFPTPLGVPYNSILVRDTSALAAAVQCDAYLIIPSYGQVTAIRYVVDVDANVSLEITDPNGNGFRTLFEEEPHDAGSYDVEWDGRNDERKLAATEGEYTVIMTVVPFDPGPGLTHFGTVLVYNSN